eukprot:6195954-Pleurochrysis_carterae.AAC.1
MPSAAQQVPSHCRSAVLSSRCQAFIVGLLSFFSARAPSSSPVYGLLPAVTAMDSDSSSDNDVDALIAENFAPL